MMAYELCRRKFSVTKRWFKWNIKFLFLLKQFFVDMNRRFSKNFWRFAWFRIKNILSRFFDIFLFLWSNFSCKPSKIWVLIIKSWITFRITTFLFVRQNKCFFWIKCLKACILNFKNCLMFIFTDFRKMINQTAIFSIRLNILIIIFFRFQLLFEQTQFKHNLFRHL